MERLAGQTSDPPNPNRCGVCPLNRIRCGVAVRIKQLPDAPGVTDRLREIGLCEERIVRLVASSTNVICPVCEARLALSHQLAQLILVEPVVEPIPA